jgi:hypothetical protein
MDTVVIILVPTLSVSVNDGVRLFTVVVMLDLGGQLFAIVHGRIPTN